VSTTTFTYASTGAYQPGQPAEITVQVWEPEGRPKAVLQLAHGMVEFIGRYDAFAQAAAARGWAVVGADFIGHGDSAPEGMIGHTGLALPNQRNVFLEDFHTLRSLAEDRFPGVPISLFGHSMGSFVVRAYLAEHGLGVAAAVICGTGSVPAATLSFARGVLALLSLQYKPDHRSEWFKRLTLGANNKPFEKAGARTEFDWLSRDEAEVDKYIADPRCGATFTLAANKVLIDAFARAERAYAATPKALPLLLVSGEEDPVGGNGAGVTAVATRYEEAGVTDVTVRLYEGARHELLNETNRAEVATDVLDWLDAHLP
jgi:alpha-beta hydrolase superfamily lysophospholipase